MPSKTFAANSSTLILNGTNIKDLIDGDGIVIKPVNPLTSHTRGINGVNIQKRADSGVHDLTVKVLRYSDSHDFFRDIVAEDTPTILAGSLKESYTDEEGETHVETYTLAGGSITDQPEDTRNNQEGNMEMNYTIRFNSVK